MFTLHVHCVPWSGQFQTHVSQRHQLYHNQVLSRTCCSLLIWPVSLKFSCAILSLGAPCIWLRTAVGGTANSLGIQPKTLKIRLRCWRTQWRTLTHPRDTFTEDGSQKSSLPSLLWLKKPQICLSACFISVSAYSHVYPQTTIWKPRGSLFCDVTRHNLVTVCRRSGTTYRSYFQASWTAWLLITRPTYSPETSVANYEPTSRNIPGMRRPKLRRGGSLTYRNSRIAERKFLKLYNLENFLTSVVAFGFWLNRTTTTAKTTTTTTTTTAAAAALLLQLSFRNILTFLRNLAAPSQGRRRSCAGKKQCCVWEKRG